MLKTIVAKFQGVMGSSLSQQSAVDAVSQWAARPSHELIFDSGRREISQYMQAVDRLRQSPNNTKEVNKLMSTAAARLKLEFLEVLKRQADYQAGPSSTTATGWSSVTDSTAYAFRYEEYVALAPEPPSDDVIIYLKNIAERIKIGDCIDVYKSVRKPFLTAQLRRLRFEELSIGTNTNPRRWDELKMKIELWVQVSKICVKILFLREKQLCDRIFEGLDGNNCSAKDECFVGTVQDFVVGLFGFVESMSLSNQSFDRNVTAVLALYDAFVGVLPDTQSLFDSNSGEGIRNACLKTLSRIENQVGRMLYDFGKDVLNEISSTDAFGDRGAVHRSTEYVMEQVGVIVRYKSLLARLIKSGPSLDLGDLSIPQGVLGANFSTRRFLEQHLILIIVVLQMNLEKKSKSYKDPALSQLFMMNNVRYIVREIEGSKELRDMIGDFYLNKLNENVKVAMTEYQSLTCRKFLDCFQDRGLYISRCFKFRPSKNAIRRRLKAFNLVFEEIKLFHSVWTIPDSQLRDEVRVSMSENLVPAYENFLEKFADSPETKLVVDKNIKYSPMDLEALVLQSLFEETEVIA